MRNILRRGVVGAASVALLGLVGVQAAPALQTAMAPPAAVAAGPVDKPVDKAKAANALGSLPMRFEANVGQTDAEAAFFARSAGGTVFLTGTDAVLTVPPSAKSDVTGPAAAGVVRMRPLDANPNVLPVGADRLPGVSNYLSGNDPARWKTNVPAFGAVRYPGVYPGIDLVFHGKQKALEYDYEIAPGADPARIAIGFDTPGPVTLEPNGDLILRTPNGDVRQSKPYLYQDIDGTRRQVPGSFTLQGTNRVGFNVGAYDHTRPLIIDPIVEFTAFLGGGGDDFAAGVALDPTGNIYVSGTTRSLDFPTAGGQISPPGIGNAFVSKLSPTGTALIYSTYLGPYTDAAEGPATDRGGPIAVDAAGSAVITGVTTSPNFPTTPNAFDRTCGSGTDEFGNPDPNCNSNQTFTTGSTTATSDVFTTTDAPFADRHVGTAIYSPNLPAGTTITAITDPSTVTVSNPATTDGTGVTFTIDSGNRIGDAFVSKLAPNGASLTYSTYLGGSTGGADESEEAGYGIAVDSEGIYVAGGTRSGDFPTTPNAFNPSCARSAPGSAAAPGDICGYNSSSSFTDGSVPQFCSCAFASAAAGLNPADEGKIIIGDGIPTNSRILRVVDGGNLGPLAIMSEEFENGMTPGTSNISFTIVDRSPTPESDAFMVRIDPRLSGVDSLPYSTYLGGKDHDRAAGVAVDPISPGTVYVGGSTRSSDFATTASSLQQNCDGPSAQPTCSDAFVIKINTKASGASSLRWSTFLGGGLDENVSAVAADPSGPYVAGTTNSPGFPTSNPLQNNFRGGSDGFVSKFNSDGTAMVYSTFLGGPGVDTAAGISVDPSGSAHVTGTGSTEFPQVGGIVQTRTDGQYAAKLTPTGSALAYSAIVSPAGPTGPVAATDAAGNTFVAGTVGEPFAYASDSIGASTRSGNDAYVLKLTAGVRPIVTDLSQTGGPIVGGTPVVITGTGFTGATNVFFGDAPATSFTVDSDTQITAVSPPKPAGTPFGPVPITVTTPQATSLPVPEVSFTIGTGIPTGPCPGTQCVNGQLIVLKTGKVLAARGAVNSLYDPATGTWRLTASCSCGTDGRAVLLPDGKVLWTGGAKQSNFRVASEESFLFDPVIETWSPTKTPAATVTTMTVPRYGHTATLLASGKVLVVGGLTTSSATTEPARDTAELYDPATGAWTPAGSLSAARAFHTATLLDPAVGGCGGNCGKVLVAFGRVPGSNVVESTNTVELYDPAAGTWSGIFTAPGAGAISPAAVQLRDGKVVILGGGDVTSVNAFNSRDATVVYDPAAGPNGAFQPGAPLNTPRSGGVPAVLLPDGGVLVAGGADERGNNAEAVAEVRDPVTGRWTEVAVLPHLAASAVLLPLGPVSVCGVRCGTVLVVDSTRAETWAPPPQTAGLSVMTGPQGTSVTITGTGLASTTSVRFGDTVAASFTPDPVTPDSRLVAVAPVHARGPVGVVVNNPSGSSAPLTFTFLTPPTVSGISPAAGPTGGGTAVTITGTNFLPGGTVSFGATPASNVTVVSSTSITATSPAGTGTADVTVTSSDGTSPTGPAAVFTYTLPVLPAPTVTGIGTGSGPAGGGTTVTITGTNFTPGSTVSFGGTPATNVTFVSPTELTATAPPGTGVVNVTVTTGGGTSPATAGAVFVFVSAGSTFAPLSPARVWDSRFGPGPVGQVGAGQSRDITVTGAGGVPATGVTAVVLNVTAVNPSAATFVTAWPTGETKPLASNLNVPPNDVRPNLIIVKVGAGGRVSFNNDAGNLDLIADVAGWYGPAGGQRYTALSPSRVWDSRFGPGPVGQVGAGQSRDVTVTGVGGVPATGVTAVVLNVTGVNPSAATFVTAWPTGETKPLASNLNVPPNDVRPNLVIVKVGAGGRVSFNNDAGNLDLIADIAGYYGPTGASFNSVSPSRVWDSRFGPGPTGKVGAGQTRDITVTGLGGVPATGVTAVVLNVTAVNPTAATFVTAWPTGEAKPLASNLNVPPNDVRPNLVIVKVGADGKVSFNNDAGDVDLIADVAGWYGTPGT